MPAKSEAQRELFAIAEHKPDILYDKNKRILGSMSKSQMHDFAATKGLKKKTGPKKFAPKVGAPKVPSMPKVDSDNDGY